MEFGMTLRQFYAGLAMQGMKARENWRELDPNEIAEMALEQADALLAVERKTREAKP
jgi:hypothetical protein